MLNKEHRQAKDFDTYLEQIINQVLEKKGLLNGMWHLGEVVSVISTKKLGIKIDGSSNIQTVPCNPDVTFSVGDQVWVVYINGNSKDKFVISKRAV